METNDSTISTVDNSLDNLDDFFSKVLQDEELNKKSYFPDENPMEKEFNIRNDNVVIKVCFGLFDDDIESTPKSYIGKAIFKANTQEKELSINYVEDSTYTDRNSIQLKFIQDILETISEKGSKRNIILISNNYYFNSLFRFKRLYKFNKDGWKTKRGTEVVNKDILQKIYDLITDNDHVVWYELYKNSQNLLRDIK